MRWTRGCERERGIGNSKLVLGKREEFDSGSSVYPMSCQLQEIGCTEDQLSKSSENPTHDSKLIGASAVRRRVAHFLLRTAD